MEQPNTAEPTLPVFRSELRSEALVEHILSRYALNDPICHLFARGINDAYRVDTPQNRYILRVSTASGHDRIAVQSELDMLRHLSRSGIAVVTPVARSDGQYVTVLRAPEGERVAALFEFVEQAGEQELTPAQAQRYGVALARMHRAADGYRGEIRRPRHDQHYFIEAPLERLSGFSLFANRAADLAYMRDAATWLWARTAQLPMTTPQYGFCHGDAMSGNALYGEDGSVTLIDFDYSGVGWRIYDLATYIWVHIINGPALDWSRQDVFRALLSGYQSLRPLSNAEYEALPVFAALRQLFLFGAGIKNSPAFGVAWMTDGWFTRMVEFIRTCQDGTWLARVGLR